jgi:hypothetical protein
MLAVLLYINCLAFLHIFFAKALKRLLHIYLHVANWRDPIPAAGRKTMRYHYLKLLL